MEISKCYKSGGSIRFFPQSPLLSTYQHTMTVAVHESY